MAKTFEKDKSAPIGAPTIQYNTCLCLVLSILYSYMYSFSEILNDTDSIFFSPDFRDMENLFCLVAPKPPEASGDGKGDGVSGEKKKKETSEVNLLDGKRSLNINIFLRQFRRWGIIRLNSGPISSSPTGGPSTKVIHRVIC